MRLSSTPMGQPRRGQAGARCRDAPPSRRPRAAARSLVRTNTKGNTHEATQWTLMPPSSCWACRPRPAAATTIRRADPTTALERQRQHQRGVDPAGHLSRDPADVELRREHPHLPEHLHDPTRRQRPARRTHAGSRAAVTGRTRATRSPCHAELDDGRIGTAIVTPDGTVQRVLDIADPTLNLVCTVWSPDDQRLACEGWDEARTRSAPGSTPCAAATAADSQRAHRSRSAGQADLPGDFSPDGSQLLFKRAHEEDLGTLLEVSVDGGEPMPVGDILVEDPGRYSPDGEHDPDLEQRQPSWCSTADGAWCRQRSPSPAPSSSGRCGRRTGRASRSPAGPRASRSADVFTSLPDGTDRQPGHRHRRERDPRSSGAPS